MAKPIPTDNTSGEYFTTLVSSRDEASEVPRDNDGPLLEGDRVGDYEVESLIGVGGGGIVYAARHRTLGHRVAIKTLRAEVAGFPGMLERFKREAAMVTKIGHPNIVQIHEFGEISAGRPYYVMELLEGSDLRKLLELSGRLSPREALDLLDPVCDAVQAAHEAGIIHRDLKATNVLISEAQGKRVVKLLDFGIAKRLSDEAAGQGLTRPGATLGTPHLMAPLQIRC
jgi:serine/threonine protein kinase